MGLVDVGVPTRDRAIFGRKHENAWAGLPVFTDDKVVLVRAVDRIEDITGRGSTRPTSRHRDGDHKRHTTAIPLIERGHACIVVRNPPGAGGTV